MEDSTGTHRQEVELIERLAVQIAQYGSRYPEEKSTVAQFLDLLADGQRAFTRDRVEGHLTGSAVILDPAGEQTLLTHHAKLGIWLQLGGHADGNPDIHDVALQEATEESGLQAQAFLSPTPEIIDLDIHRIPARGAVAAHLHYDVRYIFVADPSLATTISHESHDLQWVDLQEIDRFSTEASLLRALTRGRRAIENYQEGTR